MNTTQLLVYVALVATFSFPAKAQPGDAPKSGTVFSNVRIFDGKATALNRAKQLTMTSGTDTAYKYLLLVDGDPIANLKLIEDPAKNFLVIMKDGKVLKNTLK